MTPEQWGPILWTLLHQMADRSCRTDIYPLWNTFLRVTAITIPCQKCQKHMSDYWTKHAFLPKGWVHLQGQDVCAQIRTKISNFHNAVNEQLGKPVLTVEQRYATNIQIEETYRQLTQLWTDAGIAFLEWRRVTRLLLQLIYAT